MTKLILFITLTIATTMASAQSFEQKMTAYQKSCASGCHFPFSETPAFNFSESTQSKLDGSTKARLEQVAHDQAQIWGDTILEGDYYSKGHTQLDSVVAIFDSNEFIGYKITYSELAWYIGECDFTEDKPEAISECKEGRIHESSFVSPDFQNFFRDETDLADFSEKK
jgi:hypothetical protein